MSNTVIFVPTQAQLRNRVFQRRLWMIIRNLHYSRRELYEQIICAFRDYRGTIDCAGPDPYELPDDFDQVFGDDPHCRWFSYYLEVNPQTGGPKRPTRALKRLEILALYCQIRYPQPSRHLFDDPTSIADFD